MAGAGRRTFLIINNPKLALLFGKFQNGFDEIFPMETENPAHPDDEVLRKPQPDGCLAPPFALTIYAYGRSRVRFLIWLGTGPVKYVVGRQMNQGNIRPDSRIGQIGRPVPVYAEGGLRIVLRLATAVYAAAWRITSGRASWTIRQTAEASVISNSRRVKAKTGQFKACAFFAHS